MGVDDEGPLPDKETCLPSMSYGGIKLSMLRAPANLLAGPLTETIRSLNSLEVNSD